jgi:Zn-dependent peptidase ImmA (M78 family)
MRILSYKTEKRNFIMTIEKLRKICAQRGIDLSCFGDYEADKIKKYGGMALRYEDGSKAIFYDESAKSPIAIIAHELGHHVMGHELSFGEDDKEISRREEFEAQVFAAVFMAMSVFAEAA